MTVILHKFPHEAPEAHESAADGVHASRPSAAAGEPERAPGLPVLLNQRQAARLTGLGLAKFRGVQARLESHFKHWVSVPGEGKKPRRMYHRERLLKALDKAAEKGSL